VLKRCSKHKHQSKEETKMIWVGLDVHLDWTCTSGFRGWGVSILPPEIFKIWVR